LDETYERMLGSIEDRYHDEAVKLLRWLAYAHRPPTLGELSGVGSVDFDEHGELEDTLNILGGLVTVVRDSSHSDENSDNDTDETSDYDTDEGSEYDTDEASYFSTHNGTADSDKDMALSANKSSKVRLAHFSVQEYLESKRILNSKVHRFYLQPSAGHQLLTHSCLTYLEHYSASDEKTSTKNDLANFPLLEYAATSWYHHSSLHQCGDVSREVAFLTSNSVASDWISVHKADQPWLAPFDRKAEPFALEATAMYYASYTGLQAVVRSLISGGANVDGQGGFFGTALQAASFRGHESIAKLLVDAGADIDVQGGNWTNALQAASFRGHERIVKLLVYAGANINAQGGEYGNALQAAALYGHEKVVYSLLNAGADINAQGGFYDNALQAAAAGGFENIVHIFLNAGAEVNAQGGRFGNALQVAVSRGRYEIINTKVVQMLLDAGANVTAGGGEYGHWNALEIALTAPGTTGPEVDGEVIQMLLDAGADVQSLGQVVLYERRHSAVHEVVQMLLDAGADAGSVRFEATDEYRKKYKEKYWNSSEADDDPEDDPATPKGSAMMPRRSRTILNRGPASARRDTRILGEFKLSSAEQGAD
jgi:ankyrin repeat protein